MILLVSACVVHVDRTRQANNAPPANDAPPANTAPAATPVNAPPANTAPAATPVTAPPPANTAPAATATGTVGTAPPASTGPGSTGVAAPVIAFEEIAEPPANDTPFDGKLAIAVGRSVQLVPTAALGVWIWNEGNTWHVRTTTKGAQHRFQGVVMTTRDGTLTDVKPTKLEWNDRLRVRNGRAAAWDFSTAGHEDGFDFKTVGGQCIRFWVKVDGKADPGSVNLGKDGAHPAKWHFRLCP